MPVFDELLVKIALGEILTPSELEAFRQEARALNDVKNAVSAWMQPGSNSPQFQSISVLSPPKWKQSPLHTYSFQMQTDLSVVNNTKTFVTFDTFYQHGSAFEVDPSDQTKIMVVNPGPTFMISGIVNWDNNATGYRYAALEGFKEDGTSLGFVGFHLFAGTATEDNSFPVSFVADLAQLAEMKYFKIFLRQTSGGNLTCFYILLSAFLT
jgi:hypothetical protein